MRHKQQTPQPIKRTFYTPEEIKKVNFEVNGNFTNESRVRWLVFKKAITMYHRKTSAGVEYDDMHVIQAADGSFPYSSFSDLWNLAKAQSERLSQQYPEEVLSAATCELVGQKTLL